MGMGQLEDEGEKKGFVLTPLWVHRMGFAGDEHTDVC